MERIRVLVAGAAGRMGREVVRAVCGQEDMELVGAVDRVSVGKEALAVAGVEASGGRGHPTSPRLRGASARPTIVASLAEAIAECAPEVVVDFTLPESVKGNVETALRAKVACVVGATGLRPADLEDLEALCQETKTPCLVAPNFAIGAVLMMRFAAEAARHFDAAEIIELHHAGKVDAPSGTALRTAKMVGEGREERRACPSPSVGDMPALQGGGSSPARGQREAGIPIHSVRLPGLVAHQEVIFGGLGQTLTIRHDSISRESFMPGVLLGIRKVRGLKGLVVGLEGVM